MSSTLRIIKPEIRFLIIAKLTSTSSFKCASIRRIRDAFDSTWYENKCLIATGLLQRNSFQKCGNLNPRVLAMKPRQPFPVYRPSLSQFRRQTSNCKCNFREIASPYAKAFFVLGPQASFSSRRNERTTCARVQRIAQ